MEIEDLALPDASHPTDKKLAYCVQRLIAVQDTFTNEQDVSRFMSALGRKMKCALSKNTVRHFYTQHAHLFRRQMKPHLMLMLIKRAVRSRSGIINLSVVLPPHRFSCRYDCAFCPKEPGMPRSYLSNEDAVARASSVDFSGVQQVFSRLTTLKTNGHCLDKIEVRLLGGTFSSYPHDVVDDFIRDVYYAINTFMVDQPRLPKTLAQEIEWNSTHAQIHVVGLGLETRPDQITLDEITRFRSFGCTRVELGLQHTSDALLKKSRRGHGLSESKNAIRLLKDHGFKIEIHIMLDLPGTTPELDKECYRRVLVDDPDLFPDYLKDYPCLDVAFTEIKKWKERGLWTPYAEIDHGRLLHDVLVFRQQLTPCFVRVNRIQRDFLPAHEKNNHLGFTSTTIRSNLGQIVREEAEKMGVYCQCIRCCEIKDTAFDARDVRFETIAFQASGCTEYFIRAIIPRPNRPLLLGFLRLRITKHARLPELQGRIGLVREIHVYGPVQTVSQPQNGHERATQHRGIGTILLARGERLATGRHAVRKIAIISGVGVRSYYKQRGYTLDGTYMVRCFTVWDVLINYMRWVVDVLVEIFYKI